MFRKFLPVILLILVACEVNKQPTIATVPVVVGHGPGGPATLTGRVPGGITLLVYKSSDYTKELANLTVTSRNDSFKITDLPIDTVDIITRGSHYFAQKKSDVLLGKGQNLFSVILDDTSHFDSGGRQNYNQMEVLVTFKDQGIDSLTASSILVPYGCSVRNVSSALYFGRHLFVVTIPYEKTVAKMIEILVMDERIYLTTPNFLAYLHP